MFSLAASVCIRGHNIRTAAGGSNDIFINCDNWKVGSITLQSMAMKGACSPSRSGGVAATYGPFHIVLSPGCSQGFSHARVMGPMIDSFIRQNLNSTMFAYGQTRLGKTHTLFGAPVLKICPIASGAFPRGRRCTYLRALATVGPSLLRSGDLLWWLLWNFEQESLSGYISLRKTEEEGRNWLFLSSHPAWHEWEMDSATSERC